MSSIVDKLRSINIAIYEAQRFIDKASHAKNRLENEPSAHISGCKEVAAMKRTSLDLTRALANLRRP